VRTGIFISLGKRQPAASINYATLLSDFDRLLPLYEYVGSGREQGSSQAQEGLRSVPARRLARRRPARR
jgi:hypothetical protein